jgi:hypothetical protein
MRTARQAIRRSGDYYACDTSSSVFAVPEPLIPMAPTLTQHLFQRPGTERL